MGWWKVRDSDDLVGDDAYSLVRVAATAVSALYVDAHGRPPTATEWQRLLRDALEPIDERHSMFPTNVRPKSLSIELEPFIPSEHDPIEP